MQQREFKSSYLDLVRFNLTEMSSNLLNVETKLIIPVVVGAFSTNKSKNHMTSTSQEPTTPRSSAALNVATMLIFPVLVGVV